MSLLKAIEASEKDPQRKETWYQAGGLDLDFPESTCWKENQLSKVIL